MKPFSESSTVFFDDLAGHDRPKDQLTTLLRGDRVPHALLLTGPEGVGKGMAASALAQGLLCRSYPDRVCGECPDCQKVLSGSHPDMHRLIPEGKSRTIRIDAVLGVRERILLKPLEGRVHVVVVDDAHRLGADAQNAILKILEEPPGSVHFILVTHDPSRLLATVIYRCQKVGFGPLNTDELTRVLRKDPDFLDDEDALRRVVAMGSGTTAGMAEARRAHESGMVDAMFALAAGSGSGELVHLPDWGQDRQDQLAGLEVLAHIFRDVLILRTTKETPRLTFADRGEELLRLAERLDEDRILEILEV
ncbi:MAG: DNA polymerase III subunit, partial [Candidatus Omnitrophica bacterium]|nr:DNA polymerase III subunit [Candidatus Omnitrophota bacterium]